MEESIKQITFDEVMLLWLEAEINQVEGRNILPVAKQKGFSSITEWRLATALRLNLDKKDWILQTLDNPITTLERIIIGPYQGWSKFFNNQLNTSFAQALEIPEFFEWCQTHDRIIPISQNFPQETTIILFKDSQNRLIHIEGGHRVCAAVYAKKIGKPIDFKNRAVRIAVAPISGEEIEVLKKFLIEGTFKKTFNS